MTAGPPSVTVQGVVKRTDIAVMLCDTAMFVLFLWVQLVYRTDMLVILIPLFLIGLYFTFFCLVPYEYVFNDEALCIRHRFRRVQRISYDRVYQFSVRSNDRFLNITVDNEVKVYYYKGDHQRPYQVICYPRDTDTFTENLKKRCIALHDGPKTETKLEAFLK